MDPALWSDFYRDRIPEVTALARSVDAKLVHVLCPQLDKPFAQSAAKLWEPFEDLVASLQRDGVDHFRLDVELSGRDHLALRRDPCCHYSEAGHAALVPIFLRWVRAKLEKDAPQGPGLSKTPLGTDGSEDSGADRTRKKPTGTGSSA